MKILLLIDSLDVGGAETHVEMLATELTQMGHKIVIASSGGKIHNRLKQNGIKCIKFPPITPLTTPSATTLSLICRFFLAHKVFLRLIKQEKPDLVHAHTRRTAFLVYQICKRHKIPLVVTAHAKFSMKFPQNSLSRWGYRTITVSEDIAEHLIRHKVPKKQLEIVPNGVKLPPKIQFIPPPPRRKRKCEK